MMYGDPELWHALMGRLADIAIAFLRVQVEAGASAVQLFDSWVGRGQPGRTTGRRSCRTPAGSSPRWPPSGVPRIHFGVGTGELLGLLGEAGADVVGVDWRVPLDEAARRVRRGQGAAGQPRPGACCWPPGTWCEPRARAVLDRGPGRPMATSSTWATACCRRPTRTSWPA